MIWPCCCSRGKCTNPYDDGKTCKCASPFKFLGTKPCSAQLGARLSWVMHGALCLCTTAFYVEMRRRVFCSRDEQCTTSVCMKFRGKSAGTCGDLIYDSKSNTKGACSYWKYSGALPSVKSNKYCDSGDCMQVTGGKLHNCRALGWHERYKGGLAHTRKLALIGANASQTSITS